MINSYNDGPTEDGGKPLGPFYELETSSPALSLNAGESGTHIQRTFHFEGKEVDLRTHLHIRETAHTLYGFSSDAERNLFLLLIERVSGIGPSIGMSILSGMPVDHFKSCVVAGDAAALSQIV